MIQCRAFYQDLTKLGVGFYAGVPDSLLKDICAFIQDNVPKGQHLIAPNEGGAIACAAGYHLATGRVSLVYMQNSGLGNSVNPLTSLTDPEVYSIPMLLMIGWRGEPGVKDEPQHVKQGRITPDLLNVLEIPFVVLSDELSTCSAQLKEAVESAVKRQAPYALLVKKGTFEESKLASKVAQTYSLSREAAIQKIVEALPKNAIVLSTTGHISRELYENMVPGSVGAARGLSHKNCFYNVGAMGHVSLVALGVALEKRDRTVVCLDGDGAILMHMGGLPFIGHNAPENFKHIVLNNGSHLSVGGQPTLGYECAFADLARDLGYHNCSKAQSGEELKTVLPQFFERLGPGFLEVRVNHEVRSNLGRPKESPLENKKQFIANLRGE